jgi:hypothetical protein
VDTAGRRADGGFDVLVVTPCCLVELTDVSEDLATFFEMLILSGSSWRRQDALQRQYFYQTTRRLVPDNSDLCGLRESNFFHSKTSTDFHVLIPGDLQTLHLTV